MKYVGAMLLTMVATACASHVADGPPALRAGEDLCDGCGMAISDLRYAAAVADGGGGDPHVFLFDDVGCLVRWEAAHPTAAPRRRWVHDRASGDWIDAGTARYATNVSWATPMGSGLAAFRPGTGGSESWDELVTAARSAAAEAP